MSAKKRSWLWLWLSLTLLVGVMGREIYHLAAIDASLPEFKLQ